MSSRGSSEEPLELEYSNGSGSESSEEPDEPVEVPREISGFLRFEIPTSDDYLTVDDEQAFHVVANGDQDEEQIVAQIKEFNSLVQEQGVGYKQIKNYFDAFFSLARINSKIKNVELWLKAFKSLQKGFIPFIAPNAGPLNRALTNIMNTPGQPAEKDAKEASDVANYLLMYIYLFSRLSFHLESENIKRLLAAEKKKGARKVELDAQMESWVVLRGMLILNYTSLCEFTITDYSGNKRTGAIKYLWRPPEANKGMIKTFIETIFKFLDNPSSRYADSARWVEMLFNLVRAICIHFDYSSRMAVAIVEKTVNLEYLREATTTKYPFIMPIIKVSKNDDMEILLSHMIHHLGDLVNSDFASTSTKPYSLIMYTMAEIAPEIMIKQLSSVLPYLQSEIPQFRSAVLQCFSHLLVSKKMSEPNCLQFSRLFKLRNKMLDYCRDHLRDSSSFVRTKALSVWTTLAEAKAIPREHMKRALISAIGERLLDKSVTVRKAAFSFLSKFLKYQPHGHDFDYLENTAMLNKCLRERRELRRKDPRSEAMMRVYDEYEPVRDSAERLLKKKFEEHLNGTKPILDATGGVPKEILLGAIGSQLIVLPGSAITALAVLAIRGDIPGLNLEEESLDESVDKCISYAIQFYIAEKKIREEVDNEVQFQLEESIHDYEEALKQKDEAILALMEKTIVAKELSSCIPNAVRAVLEGEKGEIADAMAFIVECKRFNIVGANRAVRQMCSLIWRHSEDLKNSILGIAVQLFVSENKNEAIKLKSTVDNLFSVLDGMKDEERSCVEEVISNMPQKDFPKGTAKHVWNICKTDKKKRKVALQLISIFIKNDKSLRKYLRPLQTMLNNKSIPAKVRAEALLAISNMKDAVKESSPRDKAFRIPASDSLFHYVEAFAEEEFLKPPDHEDGAWFEVMQSALTIYYDIGKDTNAVVSHLTAKLFSIAHRLTGIAEYYTEEYNSNPDPDLQETNLQFKTKYTFMCNYFLERLLKLCGDIALRTVIHIDVAWLKEMKKLPEVVADARSGAITAPIAPIRVLKDWEFRAAMHKGVFNYATRDDTNAAGAAHADEERLRAMADNMMNYRLFRNNKLFSRMLPFIMYALRADLSPPNIRDAAAVAFSKFMLVSKELSTKAAPTFFMLLNNSQNPVLRHNLVIAAGDLCFRMPNLVELYSNNLYSMTKDPETMVRETSLLVLTHLLTNQILKQRGSLADVAKLITDPAIEISTLTKEFFVELGTKGSRETIYNLMPDFISRLSRSSREVSLQQFKIIMAFLLQQINKDKQMDSLVEKLCARFSFIKTDQATSKNSKIAHYYSYCISQINLSEKAFNKMRDNLNNFATFMEDQQVYEDFKLPLEKLIKSTKSVDLKTDAEDFLVQIDAIFSRGLNGDELIRPIRNQLRIPRSGRGRTRGGGATRATRNRKQKLVEISEESELSSIDGE